MSTPSNDATHCAIRLRATVTQLSHRLRAAARDEPLSVAKLSAMGQLYRAGTLSTTELARLEGVKLQSLTRLLNELESDGLLRRERNPADARQTVLSLSHAGLLLLRGELERRESVLSAAIEDQLNASQRALLMKACVLMDQLAASLSPSPD